jgi:hypothetical protein
MEQLCDDLICPISLELFQDPITVPCCGNSFSRQSLIKYFSDGNKKCPNCRGKLADYYPETVKKNIANDK